MQNDFRSLKTRMQDCRLCADLPLGPNPVFQLDQRVKILIVGQAPGRIAHEKSRPFDDPSGDRLRGWLGLERSTFYTDPRVGIFPMGLCFPGSGAHGDHAPRKICAQTWRAQVMQTLGEVDLTLVLGAYAIGWHVPQLQKATVTDAVRQMSDGRSDLFVLPHPSPRNNRWLKQNTWFERDVVPRVQERVQRSLRVLTEDLPLPDLSLRNT